MRDAPGPSACPQCGGETAHAFDVRDINRRTDATLFSYDRCAACGVIRLRNAPGRMADYYPEDYYTIARSREELAAWSRTEAYKLEIVSRFRGPGRLIEIGPASGAFAYLAKTDGYEVTAIEMDKRCCDYLATEVGVRVIHSSDEAQALASAQPADVIALWHVIEHLNDPWRMLEIAADKLRPGGILVLATPNPDAWQFRLFGARWVHVDAPRHLWLIPARVLAHRGEALGLRVLLQTTRDPGSLHWNRFGWEWSLANFFGARPGRGLPALAGRAASLLASIAESREGQGCAYTMVLEKRAP